MAFGNRRNDAQNWEGLVASDDPSLDAFPREPRRSFDAWVKQEDARLKRAHAEAKGSVFDMQEIARRFSGALGDKAGPVEVEVFGALALLLWGSDKRGSEETRIFREERKWAPFSHPTHALAAWLFNTAPMGMGEVKLNIAEDRVEDVRARARELHQGRKLPLDADGIRLRGFLPAANMRAKQSRNGSTGGTRGEAMVIRRADTHRAVMASGVGPVDLGMLIARDIGVPIGWDGDTLLVKFLRRKVPKGAAPSQEIVKLTATELAEQFKEKFGIEVSAEAIGKRLARARGRIEEKLIEFGLMLGSGGSAHGRRAYGDAPVAKAKPRPKAAVATYARQEANRINDAVVRGLL